MAEAPKDNHDELMAMLKRRGFLQPSYEIYGGLAGFYDYGPLGQGLKTRFEALWRRHYVVDEGFGEISCPTIAPEPVFRASGHLAAFKDVIVECTACGNGHRFDHFIRDEVARIKGLVEKSKLAPSLKGALVTALDARRDQAATIASPEHATGFLLQCIVQRPDGVVHTDPMTSGTPFVKVTGLEARLQCQSCASPQLGEPRPFNLMFATKIGPGSGKPGYMRPETAQGMFVNFDWLYRYSRERIPFGAVQIGRAYRNEIAPRQGLIRLREFWQAEAEVFVDPDDKRHPRFAEVMSLEANLVPAGHEGRKTVRTTFGDAVGKKVIANEMVAYFLAKTQAILLDAGLKAEHVRFRQHEKDEMAHYAADCWDAEYFSGRFGWVECVGIADRGSYDLAAHAKHSGQRLEAFRRFDQPVERDVVRVVPDMGKLGPLFKGKAKLVADAMAALDGAKVTKGAALKVAIEGGTVDVPADAFRVEAVRDRVSGEWFMPHVVEPSYGIDRILYAVMEHAFDQAGEWVVLRLKPWMAPIQVGVLPLLAKDGLPEKAEELLSRLKQRGLVTYYDNSGAIGRRYARLDEIGTPFCVTIDHQTLEDGTVTVRERDSQKQVRLEMGRVVPVVEDLLSGRAAFSTLVQRV